MAESLEAHMSDLSVTFTGIRFENPFLLSSAPPTESESNILRAYESGGAACLSVRPCAGPSRDGCRRRACRPCVPVSVPDPRTKGT